MEVVDDFVSRRRGINELYLSLLQDIDGISFLANPSENFNSNHWLTCILIDEDITGFSSDDLRLVMNDANIETHPLWKPMHLQAIFKDSSFYGDGTSEMLFEKGLCLPSGAGSSDEDIDRVANVIVLLYAERVSVGEGLQIR